MASQSPKLSRSVSSGIEPVTSTRQLTKSKSGEGISSPTNYQQPDPTKATLRISNIPIETLDSELPEPFKVHGKITAFKRAYTEDGKPQDYATCQYEDANDAERAARNLNGYELKGNVLKVELISETASNASESTASAEAQPVNEEAGIALPEEIDLEKTTAKASSDDPVKEDTPSTVVENPTTVVNEDSNAKESKGETMDIEDPVKEDTPSTVVENPTTIVEDSEEKENHLHKHLIEKTEDVKIEHHHHNAIGFAALKEEDPEALLEERKLATFALQDKLLGEEKAAEYRKELHEKMEQKGETEEPTGFAAIPPEALHAVQDKATDKLLESAKSGHIHDLLEKEKLLHEKRDKEILQHASEEQHPSSPKRPHDETGDTEQDLKKIKTEEEVAKNLEQ